ncbi:unnamed protein product [Closterium sp. NIES-54]
MPIRSNLIPFLCPYSLPPPTLSTHPPLQYSTGKTTFIRHLLSRPYPGAHIGPEPTTDRFVVVMVRPPPLLPSSPPPLLPSSPSTPLLSSPPTFSPHHSSFLPPPPLSISPPRHYCRLYYIPTLSSFPLHIPRHLLHSNTISLT